MPGERVATTAEATVMDPTQDTPTIGDRLRVIADWLDANPAADPHSIETFGATLIVQDYSCHTREQLVARVRALGGRWDKLNQIESLFEVARDICPGVRYRITVSRGQVCEREQVGVRTVTVPDPDLIAGLPVVTREEPVYEWRCGPLLDSEAA